MTIEERKQMIEELKYKEHELTRKFSYDIHNSQSCRECSIYAVSDFRILVKIQNLIEELERHIALEEGKGYVNKFGKIVFSKEELNYWNNLYDEVCPVKEKGPIKELK